MPPKRVGRPPGSRNKAKSSPILRQSKTRIKTEKKLLKSEKFKLEKIIIDYENDSGDDVFVSKDRTIVVPKNKVLFSCKLCPNKNFKFEKHYKAHVLSEHSTIPGSIGCNKCHVTCPNKEVLANHVKKVHERSLHCCQYCNREFVRRAHVLRHMAQKGCDGSSVMMYPCEICSAAFTRKDNLIVHLRTMHIARTVFKCKQLNCDFQTKNFTKLVRHWHSKHAEVPNRFDCDMCGKSTMSRAAMLKHLEIHGEKKYACDACGYETFTLEVMRRHVLTHVAEKPYKCSLCPQSYIQRGQLERHLEKHVGNVCNTCGKIFEDKPKLLLHIRSIHLGISDRKCHFKDCIYSYKEFPSEEKLSAHLLVHISDKEYECEVCCKKFPSEANMRRHLSTHTLDKPRRCMYCVSARAYVRGQQLVRHVRKFHALVFTSHLTHVRTVLGVKQTSDRVSRSEMESILNLLDAESERILEGCSGAGVLYGGMQADNGIQDTTEQGEDGPLMSEQALATNLEKLLAKLIDEDTLVYFGWPEAAVDTVLERVIEQCGAKAADRDKWSRVQRLRENAKHLFLYVVDDKNVARMLGTHTIDQIIKHILHQVADEQTATPTPNEE